MQVVAPRMKGFIALDAHPVGCAKQVESLVDEVADVRRSPLRPGPVIVVGSSGGYGLPAAAVAAFRYRQPVVGVCLERPAQRGRTASAGWYTTTALHRHALARGAEVATINADCFAEDTKAEVVRLLERQGIAPSALIYSVAAPVRTHPATSKTYRSVLKPIDESFTTKTIKLDTGEVTTVTLEPATPDEVDATVAVMGGEDWRRWIEVLSSASLIEPGFRTVAFNYVGPPTTQPIYRSGTIGRAKAHLEATAHELDATLAARGGSAWTSVNAAAVTQSSAAIPAVPLYLSLLLRVAEEAGVLESPTHQIVRLFDDFLTAAEPVVDDQGRIRLDDWELNEPIQQEIDRRWQAVSTETLAELAAFDDFRAAFHRLFGFGAPGVDYDEAVDVDVPWPES